MRRGVTIHNPMWSSLKKGKMKDELYKVIIFSECIFVKYLRERGKCDECVGIVKCAARSAAVIWVLLLRSSP